MLVKLGTEVRSRIPKTGTFSSRTPWCGALTYNVNLNSLVLNSPERRAEALSCQAWDHVPNGNYEFD